MTHKVRILDDWAAYRLLAGIVVQARKDITRRAVPWDDRATAYELFEVIDDAKNGIAAGSEAESGEDSGALWAALTGSPTGGYGCPAAQGGAR